MKVCANPECDLAGVPQPWENFNKDVSREDGRARICRECNKRKCKSWYQAAPEGQRMQAREYKRKQRAGEIVPDRARSEAQRVAHRRHVQEVQEEEAADWKLIRFTEKEWMFCLLQGQALGLKPEAYVRLLVKNAKFESENKREAV